MSNRFSDPWQLVIAGDYDHAIAAYTKQIENGSQRVFNLYNRGTVYLLTGQPARALEDFQLSLSENDPRYWSSGQFARQGVCYWYLDQPDQAVEAWREAGTAPYTDIAGGVESPIFLLYAGERLESQEIRREAVALLRRHARRKLGTWPGQAVPYLLGKTNLEDLEKALAAATTVPKLRERYQCQFDFYVALHSFGSGDIEQFRDRMVHCASNSRGMLEEEYYIARWEVNRDFPGPAF